MDESSEDGWQKFFRLCQEVKSPKLQQELFELFLTKEEIEMVSARYWVVQALMKGELTQREIAKKFGASIAQITRGSNALKSISPKLENFLNNQLNNDL
jgi:TrpR family trp operon transcriptional repressor